ncbi:hypothetical protein JHK84_046116 [Glycine max]|nr:hypothetical protein JHK86_046106 [Glycine max]KAG4942000.1 hypothetical protein JHK85_046646 [Glycine max]KAG5101147.1 hypothetical protein JHK84_046116 [Glycine max]
MSASVVAVLLGSRETKVIGDSDSEELFEINLKKPLDAILREDCESILFSLDIDNGVGNDGGDDVVYVAVGNDGDSSTEALSWASKHAMTPSATV